MQIKKKLLNIKEKALKGNSSYEFNIINKKSIKDEEERKIKIKDERFKDLKRKRN